MDDLDRRDQRLKHDALLLGGVDLFGPRGHLGARAAIEDRHLLGAEAQSGRAASMAELPPPITATRLPTATVPSTL